MTKWKRVEFGGVTAGLFKPDKWDWPSCNDRWYIAARWYHLGIGVVRTYWGCRILLVRWQICIHTKEKS